MIKNYLITALRNLYKNRTHTLVNLLGLALGIAGSLVLLLYVQYHRNFDRHWDQPERLYRTTISFEINGELRELGLTTLPIVSYIRENLSQVEALTFMDMTTSGQFTYDRNGQRTIFPLDEGLLTVDSVYQDIFPLTFTDGSWEAFVSNPQGLVLTESVAQRWFGQDDPIGKYLTLNNEYPLQVVGLVPDPVPQSDLQYTAFLNTQLFAATYQEHNSWGHITTSYQGFLRMQPNATEAEVEAKLVDYLKEMFGENWDESMLMGLQPLLDLHKNEELEGLMVRPVPNDEVALLLVIALVLVLTACINFVNLSTALAGQRAKEVGIRKSLGGMRGQLMGQFLGETTVIVLLALLVGLGLAELTLVQLSQTLGFDFRLSDAGWQWLVPLVAGLGVLVVLLSGLYPSLVMSGFSPLKALKGQSRSTTGGGSLWLRKGLVVLQFGISQVMIICTVVVVLQYRYTSQKDLGMNPEAVVMVTLPRVENGAKRNFRDYVATMQGITAASLSNKGAASDNISVSSMDFGEHEVDMEYLSADEAFMDLYELPLIAGEGLVPTDSAQRCVVNAAFAREFGYSPDSILGQSIQMFGQPIMITGVVQDFHNHSLRSSIRPLVLVTSPDRMNVLNLKLSGDYGTGLEMLSQAWEERFPEYALDYEFQDVQVEQFYEADQRQARLFQLFSIVAIVIGCLGLYGLANFLAMLKNKEIGVRKVLGASVQQILWIFSREYLVLISLGFVLAVVAAWQISAQLLQGYEYRITVDWWVYGTGLLLTLLIALITVGYRSLRAATMNPVKALKDE